MHAPVLLLSFPSRSYTPTVYLDIELHSPTYPAPPPYLVDVLGRYLALAFYRGGRRDVVITCLIRVVCNTWAGYG